MKDLLVLPSRSHLATDLVIHSSNSALIFADDLTVVQSECDLVVVVLCPGGLVSPPHDLVDGGAPIDTEVVVIYGSNFVTYLQVREVHVHPPKIVSHSSLTRLLVDPPPRGPDSLTWREPSRSTGSASDTTTIWNTSTIWMMD
jgi:hypothetical protein